MVKFCINCGKPLSFFSGLFRSVCNECSQKKNPEIKIPILNTSSQLSKIHSITEIGGEIAYFGLEKWWMNELTQEEREIILSVYQPFGLSKDSLIKGKITYSSQTATGFLTGLLSWFKKPEYQNISAKIIKQTESMTPKKGSIMDRHFF